LKTAHTHKKKMEIIEILDSDEEGDERVRIVQQRHEPNLRPIQEEGNGDGDVIMRGRGGGGVIRGWRGGQREKRTRLAGVFFYSSRFFFLSVSKQSERDFSGA